MESGTTRTELENLRTALAGLEAQRAMLGDAIVEPALASLREKIAALEASGMAPLPQRGGSAPVEERRIVTILFTDIVGSTALAEKLDPEDWRQVVAAVHSLAGGQIQQHGGTVVQYLGDGLLALFGAQTPSERDPENAIRAALGVQSEIGRWQMGVKSPNLQPPTSNLQLPASNFQPPIASLQLRIGIHTGLVVVGELGSDARREFTATGDAMNLAARLQSAAPPGGVLISHDAYRHVRGVFDVATQPPLSVKGKSEPIQTYVVQRARPRPFHTVTRGVADIETRTIGREAELSRLQAACARAIDEHKLVWAQLVGAPGIGKSRLLAEMAEYIALRPEEIALLKARAFQGDERQAFGLIRRAWFDRFHIAEDAPLAEAEAQWVERFQRFRGAGHEEAAHALGLLVGLPFADSPHIGAMRHDPAQVKGRAIVVSREFLAWLRQRMHLVILLEDLHWVDASSWDYLAQVILEAEPASHGLFVLASARPDWTPPRALIEHPDYVQEDLIALPDPACRQLVADLLRRVEDVPDDVIRLIVDRSEGVPYFTEEIVNWFLDRGIIDRTGEPWRLHADRLQGTPLPATLQHLLLTRLSSLKEAERAALQRGSIFGRSFWEGGLQALGVPDSSDTLSRLQPRNFVERQRESSLAGDREWSFHHALLRDVAYESVLKKERPGLHKGAAEWLEAHAHSANRLDEFAGILAEHAERAGEAIAAVDWYTRAGERAKSLGATREARRFFERALDLAPLEDRERRWRALLGRSDVLSLLGETDARRASLDALLGLAQQLDDARLAEARYREGNYWDSRGDYRAALLAYETAIMLAQRAGYVKIEALAMAVKSIGQNRLGDGRAAATAEAALALIPHLEAATASRIMSNVAVCYVESGDLAKAAQLHGEQATINHRLGDRASEANALSNLGYDYTLLGLYDAARGAQEQALRIDQAIGARRESAYAMLNLGLAYWRLGDNDAAQNVIQLAQDALVDLGDAFGHAAGVSYLALVTEQAGDVAGARERFEQAKDAFTRLNVHAYAHDALAGLARCALAQGDRNGARRHAMSIWDYLQQSSAQGMELPARAYLTCAEIFESLGDAERSRAAVEEGYRDLIQRTQRISSIAWGKSFLENVPEHRAIIERRDLVAARQP